MKFNMAFGVGNILLLLAIIGVAGCINITAETDERGETKLEVKPNFLHDLGFVRFTKATGNRNAKSPVRPEPTPNNDDNSSGGDTNLTPSRELTPKTVTHMLAVGYHESVVASGEDAEKILEDAKKILKGASDTAKGAECDVTLILDGSISTFSKSEFEKIDTKSKFEKVTRMPGVRVVKEVRWCNGQGSAFPLGGCSVQGGKSFVVQRFSKPDLESILWLHEYGHNKNISHRDDHETAVMHSTVHPDHKMINKAECDAFRIP